MWISLAHLTYTSLLFSQSIGPLYPFANYKILNSVLIAASSYLAIALVCCFVFFPETVNHAYLGLLSTILDKVKALLSSQDDVLSPMPGDFGPGCPKLKGLIATRVAVMTMYQNCEYHLTIPRTLAFTAQFFSDGIDNLPSKRIQYWALEW
jgi:Putative ER transporter, 6TM, N-terminal